MKKYEIILVILPRLPPGPGLHLCAVHLLLVGAEHVRDGALPRRARHCHLPLRKLPARIHCQEEQIRKSWYPLAKER